MQISFIPAYNIAVFLHLRYILKYKIWASKGGIYLTDEFVEDFLGYLNLIHHLTTIENAKKTQNMILNIVDLIKYKFTRKNEIVTLKEELVQIENLVEIFRARFRENLIFENTIDGEFTYNYIPNYMLMTFVENALFHGLMPKEGDWRLAIYGQEYENHIELQVVDSGIGFDTSALNAGIKAFDTSDNEVGTILSAMMHIQTFYKGNGDIRINSLQGKGTTVKIKIPRNLV